MDEELGGAAAVWHRLNATVDELQAALLNFDELCLPNPLASAARAAFSRSCVDECGERIIGCEEHRWFLKDGYCTWAKAQSSQVKNKNSNDDE